MTIDDLLRQGKRAVESMDSETKARSVSITMHKRKKKFFLSTRLIPATNDLKVILNTLVVDELVVLKVRHSNLLVGPVGSSLSIGARRDLDCRGDGL
jgi:hypothetical protein